MSTGLETTFTFRNMESTEALRDHTVDKLDKLSKYTVKHPGSAHVILKVEGPRHMAEVTVNIKGGRYVGLGTSNDMYTSIDSAIHKIETQLSRKKERITHRKGK